MMKYILFAIFVTGLDSANLYSTRLEKGCSSSSDCSGGFCCRDGNNKLVDSTSWWGQDLFIGGENTGTCKTMKGQKGEVCSGGCQCDQGLACYTPKVGICCPTSTCQPEDFVKQQEEYWKNCFKNPNCSLPQK